MTAGVTRAAKLALYAVAFIALRVAAAAAAALVARKILPPQKPAQLDPDEVARRISRIMLDRRRRSDPPGGQTVVVR